MGQQGLLESAVRLGQDSIRRLQAAHDEVLRVQSSGLLFSDSLLVIERLQQMCSIQLETVKDALASVHRDFAEAQRETFVAVCGESLKVLHKVVPLLGAVMRSSSLRLAFELYDPLRNQRSSSVDLRLGCWFTTFRSTQSSHFSAWSGQNTAATGVIAPTAAQQEKCHYVRFGSPFVLHPGQFALGVTLEWLRMPLDLSAQVSVRSSLSRYGLMLAKATGVHPGFTGCLTLELSNVGAVPMEVTPGMAICQLFFHRVESSAQESSEADRPRISQFIGNRRPVLRVPKLDEIAMKLSNGGSTPPAGR
jgi:dCTP deaminase